MKMKMKNNELMQQVLNKVKNNAEGYDKMLLIFAPQRIRRGYWAFCLLNYNTLTKKERKLYLNYLRVHSDGADLFYHSRDMQYKPTLDYCFSDFYTSNVTVEDYIYLYELLDCKRRAGHTGFSKLKEYKLMEDFLGGLIKNKPSMKNDFIDYLLKYHDNKLVKKALLHASL